MIPSQKDLVTVFVTTQQRGINYEQDHVAPCSVQSTTFFSRLLIRR